MNDPIRTILLAGNPLRPGWTDVAFTRGDDRGCRTFIRQSEPVTLEQS